MRYFKTNFFKSILFLFGAAIMLSFQYSEHLAESSLSPLEETSNVKSLAFQILKTKCNVCHVSKNPLRVFTADNMSKLAPKIYKQVFIKKRMPKGKAIRLTSEEYQTLKKWLFTENIN